MTNLKTKLANKFGSGVKTASEAPAYDDITWFSTGSHTLNKCINYKGLGIPTRYVSEFYGDFASGKSLLALHCLKSAQTNKGVAILFDTEGSFDKKLAEDIGIDLKELILFEPTLVDEKGKVRAILMTEVVERIEGVINTAREELGEEVPICIVWDSLGATNSKRDLEETADQGANAKEVKACLKRIRPLVNASNTALIIINQVYDVISRFPVAETQKATGGRGVSFHSHIRVKFIAKRGKDGKILDDGDKEDSDNIKGARLYFEIAKNRVGPPFKKGSMDFYFDVDGRPSLDYYSGYMEYLIEEGLVDNKSSKGWIVVGKDKYRKSELDKILKEHPELI